MRYKKEILDKIKRLLIYAERLAIDNKGKYQTVDKFIDSVRVLELVNELKVLLGEYKQPKSKFRQLEIAYEKEESYKKQ